MQLNVPHIRASGRPVSATQGTSFTAPVATMKVASLAGLTVNVSWAYGSQRC